MYRYCDQRFLFNRAFFVSNCDGKKSPTLLLFLSVSHVGSTVTVTSVRNQKRENRWVDPSIYNILSASSVFSIFSAFSECLVLGVPAFPRPGFARPRKGSPGCRLKWPSSFFLFIFYIFGLWGSSLSSPGLRPTSERLARLSPEVAFFFV
jgi:hypothetical protein